MYRKIAENNPTAHGLVSLKQVIDLYAASDPHLFQYLARRRVPRPDGYPDPRASILPAMAGVLTLREQGVTPLSAAAAINLIHASVAASHHFPVFHLTHDLAAAFAQTDVDDSFDLLDLEWPFPAFTLFLPDHSAIQTPDGPVGCLYFSRLPAGRLVPPVEFSLPLSAIEMTENKTVLVGGIPSQFPATSYASIVPSLVSRMVDDDTPVLYDVRGPGNRLVFESNAQTTAEVTAFNRSAAKFLALTLLYLHTTGRVAVSGGEMTRRESWKGSRRIEPLYSPTWIGAEYHLRSEAPTKGTHASPAMHHRRGHLRQQACGPNWSERRPTWVQPMLVGAGERMRAA